MLKNNAFKFCSAVLSATTLMSMVTAMPVGAVDNLGVNSNNEQIFTMTADENGIHFIGPTGVDTSVNEQEYDSATEIESVSEYYKSKEESKVNSGSYATENLSASLPSSIDNSDTEYFPQIGNQGSTGSCVNWAQTYYQFTYMMNKSMGVTTTPENSFSYKWTYNFANGGKAGGTWDDDVYDLMKEIGNVPLSMVPYDGEHFSWTPVEDVWKTALKYRIKDYQTFKDIGSSSSQITSTDDSDLQLIKTALSNGEVLTFTTVINKWNITNLKTNSNAPENDKYAGEYVVTSRIGSTSSHRMTLVGYNDNIWTDLNNNNSVDSGEMGAFKVANSWGDDYANDGFIWIAYDALNQISSVSGVENSDNRYTLMWDVTRIDVLPYDSDSSIYLKYTLNTCDRSQAKIYITAEKDGTEYTYEAGPKRDHGMDDSTYSYDGTTNSNDGTMVYALSNVVPDLTSENLHEYTWSVTFSDTNSDGKAFTVKNVEIVDEATNRVCKPENVFPFTLDGTEKTVVYPAINNYSVGLIGDVNKDTEINITDALLVMKYNVGNVDATQITLELADCDKDGTVDIRDAIYILRYAVGSDNVGYIGEECYTETPTEPTDPTDPTSPTEEPTEPVEENIVTFTNAYSWSGTIYCYYWSDTNKSMTTWPGKAMTSASTDSNGKQLYTYELPDDATYVIFTNGSYQTVDIAYSGGEVSYSPTTTDSKGHYYVET